MTDNDVREWLETEPGNFESSSMFDVLQTAYESFSGRKIGGFDVWFLGAIERCGYVAQAGPNGNYVLSRFQP